MDRRSFLQLSSAGATAALAPRPARAAGRFPADFAWGAASAAYQIEGGAFADGKGPSVWDHFSHRPGVVWKDQNGDVACDHYHRYKDDVALMKQLGLRAYRLSVSWPRVMPDGAGAVNAKGLDFYDRLVDELLRAQIVPYVTLYHWDLPLASYRRGGFLNRDLADWFADYAKVVVGKLSDRVSWWMPFNEPQVFLGAGLYEGRHAPGDKVSFGDYLLAVHNCLRAHGKAVQAIRAAAKQKPRVGCAQASYNSIPATDRPEDLAAARARFFSSPADTYRVNAWYLDPMFLGHYPEDGVRLYGRDMPRVASGDMELIHQPLDYLGINLYNADLVRRGRDGQPEVVPFTDGFPVTGMDWPVTPPVMRHTPHFLHQRYRKPLLVTENGVSVRDWIAADGKVHDPQRIDFTATHLRELARAMAEGVPVLGYFHWSILDNFEWAHGYKQRFGLVYVDYPTQRRIPKDSAYWYRDLIASNGQALFG